MKRIAIISWSLAALTACGTASAPNSNQVSDAAPSFERVRFNFKVPPPPDLQLNECPPQEAVLITDGMFHVQGYEERAADGTLLRVVVHFNAMGFQGIGLTTGLKYQIQDNDKTEVVFDADEALSGQETDVRFRLNRQGSLDNMWVRATFRFTAPDDFEVIRSELECRG
jgi:hypothetical protein